MKEVWLLNHYAQEPSNAGGTRHYMFAKNLSEFGWKMSIIAASVELNTGRQRLKPEETSRIDEFEKVPFLWIKTPSYSGNGFGRMWNMLVFAWRSWLLSSRSSLAKPAVVIGSSVHPFAAVSGALIARSMRVPFVFEVRDLWPQTLIDLGRIADQSLLAYILRKLERWLYFRASKIIVLLPHAHQYITPIGIPRERIHWLPNGVDLDNFPAYPIYVRDESKFTLMYFGAHGEANGLDNVLDAFRLAKDMPGGHRLRLRIIGDGPLKTALIDKAACLGLGEDVLFESPVPKDAIPQKAAEADGFVFNLVNAPVFKYGISSNKLFDFMAAARPIIFCCAASNNPVADAGAGLTVSPGDPKALANAMLELSEVSLEGRRVMGENGRHYVTKHHDFRSLARRLSIVLDEIIS